MSQWPDEGTPLTEMELRVLTGLSVGDIDRLIAAKLGVSTDSVKYHVRCIFHRLGAFNRAHAVAIGLRRQLIR